MFIYMCQAAPCFQFSKKKKKKKKKSGFRKDSFVVCGCLLVVCGGFSDGLGSFVAACGRLDGVCGGFWWFVIVASFSNYDF